MAALQPVMAEVINQECQSLCHRNEDFILRKSSPEELKKFSIKTLGMELEEKAPFMFSVICTISGKQINHACAAAAIALRGRESHLSAFSYYINSVLQYGGAKKAVFERLSKMGITTTHNNAVLKQQAMSKLCGEDLQRLKARIERPATEQPVTPTLQSQLLEESDMSDLGLGFLALDDGVYFFVALSSNDFIGV